MKPQLVKLASLCLITTGSLLSSCSKQSEVYQYPVNQSPAVSPTIVDIHLTSSSSSFDYSKVNVDLKEMEFNTSNDPGIVDGWERINLETTGAINLLSLVNGNSIRLNTDMIPGNVKQLRLKLGDANTVEINGVVKPLTISSQLRENGLTIYTHNAASAEYTNSLWLHFDASHSVRLDDNTGEYALVPAVNSFDGETTGSIEGYVWPADAMATIHLQTDQGSRNVLLNTSGIADVQNNGYFKFVGLPEGVYQVDMMAGDGSTRRKTVTLIEVKSRETSNLGPQVLQ